MKRRRLLVATVFLGMMLSLLHTILRVEAFVRDNTRWNDGPLLGNFPLSFYQVAPFHTALLLVALGLAYAYGTRLDRTTRQRDLQEKALSEIATTAGKLALAPLGCSFFFLLTPLPFLFVLGFYATPWLIAAWLLWATVAFWRSARKGVVPTDAELFLFSVLAVFLVAAILLVMPW